MDKKALRILKKAFWSSLGWNKRCDTIAERIENNYLTIEEFEYAKNKGLMFEEKDFGHDECVQRVCDAVAKINEDDLAKAFLSSLSTRTLYMRSAIACYRNVKNIRPHSYVKCKDDVLHGYTYNHFECEICKGPIPFFDARNQEILKSFGEYRMKNSQGIPSADLNVLNFERIKWGGIRLHDLIYCMLDLEAFLKLEITDPTDKDISFFKQLLETIKGCEANDAPNQLEKRITELTERSLSNKAERSRIIEILSNLHILRPSKVRPDRGSKNDWGFVQHWRGEDSYSKEAVEKYFGKYL